MVSALQQVDGHGGRKDTNNGLQDGAIASAHVAGPDGEGVRNQEEVANKAAGKGVSQFNLN
jgi:hypothetical protein